MTQTASAVSSVPSGRLDVGKLSERELFELGQYEKIIQLRDVILSREHPTTNRHHSSNASPSLDSKIAGSTVPGLEAQRQLPDKHASAFAVPSQQPQVTDRPKLDSGGAEKSGQRVNAEFQVQRERLERALKDEVEQLRVDKVTFAEPSAELDSSDVLAKALAIVEATAASAVDGENLNANAESTNDSFDESTFYSSRHDTPESNLVSLIRNPSQDVQAANPHPQHKDTSRPIGIIQQQQQQQQQQPPPRPSFGQADTAAAATKVAELPAATRRSDPSITNANLTLQRKTSEAVLATDVRPQYVDSSQRISNPQLPQPKSGLVATIPVQATTQPAPTTQRSNHSVTNASLTSQMSIVPGLNNYVQATGTSNDLTQTVSGVASRSEAPRQDSLRTSISQIPVSSNTQASRDDGLEILHPPSPLVRNHNTLQPVAPQPTHPSSISALTVASPAVHDTTPHAASHRNAVATPAQVITLRTEPNGGTSPDSSSQSGGKKRGKGKKKKKKKRKADMQGGGVSTESMPVIKQEARSPSPLNAPSYIRPSKRARHVQEQPAAHEYDTRYGSATAHVPGVPYVSRPAGDHVIPVGHSATTAYQPSYGSAANGGESRYSSGRYYDEQAIASEGPRHHEGHHGLDHPTHYLTRAAPAPEPVSQVRLAESHPISSRPYRDFQDGLRMSAHPDGETFMAPPRPAPARILVDAYGREYIEPSHHISSRLSVASPPRHGEHEVLYERLPPRAISRHPVPGAYEDGGLLYSAAPPMYALPRRVVTQPGYTNHDYRDVRQREFSSRPPPPAHEDFVQVLAPNERRFGEDGYSARPASVRPVDSVRYPMPPDYGRVRSVRPEVQVAADYGASVHPDGRRETIQPYMRGYVPAPAQEPAMQRPYSARPPEPSQSGQLRGTDEIAFIERPSGATQEIVYADDARREYFR
ncbi:hypothetical protein E4U43_005635 [Claviceps pusilla]|uniref:Uncharacterized protein n=1 Tax=Claviceps pusilla TaxID=123648 RepID=A0A9P7NGH5_9HYPO|nr:hypothetical protein E4U43_005635 [Claviceps pusilla]